MKIPAMPAAGDIWMVLADDSDQLHAWCHARANETDAALLSFSQHASLAGATGWTQARYYADEGETVADVLSYESVYEINPFEIRARLPEPKRVYAERLRFLLRLMDLRRFKDHPVIALSNGETRRLLLARALARNPKLLILDDPAAGMDASRREWLKAILAALASRGLAILFACRHVDEAPPHVARWLRLSRTGTLREISAPARDANAVTDANPPRDARETRKKKPSRGKRIARAKPVVEINHLHLAYGSRVLFDDFSWTVREGERWILRGENGCGKTTLFALIAGDSPLAYAADIRVFGVPRDRGCVLATMRKKIGFAAAEQQAYLGREPEELLAHALRGNPKLLLLDEPFMNMSPRAIQRARRALARFLRAHPKTAAILISHRADEAPACFARECVLTRPRAKEPLQR